MREQNQQPPDSENHSTSNLSKNQQPPDSENHLTSNPSKNQQPPDRENDKGHSPNHYEIHPDKITNFLEKIIGVPASQLFKNWLNNNKQNFIVRNFILIVLATYGGVNFLAPSSSGTSDEICQEFNKDQSNEINVISPPNNATVPHLKFGCEYITSSGEKQTLYVQYKALREVKHNYKQEPIEERHRQVLCGNPSIYLPKLQEKGYSETEYNFIDEGAVLLEGEKVQNIYPVFRWVCQYELTKKTPDDSPNLDNNNELEFGNGLSTIVTIGIDMDKKFCQQRFGEMNLNKATYHDHNDPHSWYCTNTEFNLN